VRLSVGTESVEDLVWDLGQGFTLVAATAGKATAGEGAAMGASA
jgi:O-acetylhomoserine (thiol)-lyase